MSATSTASAHWDGTTIDGKGSVSTKSPAMDATPLTWKARIGEEAGTTPEELLAAAHAGCYLMALGFALSGDGHEADHLDASAVASFGPVDGGFAVTGMELTVEGVVPGLDDAAFMKYAEAAKDGCPLSKAIEGNVPVKLKARLAATA